VGNKNIWLELQGFHWTASLLSEGSEWDLAEGGGSTSLVSSLRWRLVIVPWRTDISRCLETTDVLFTKDKQLTNQTIAIVNITTTTYWPGRQNTQYT
jgi:hypothetical protein